jgi:mannose-6-phosphate isomerase-like protein (cupin superfamily)
MSRRASARQSPLLAALAAAELAVAADASARALCARLARLTRRDISPQRNQSYALSRTVVRPTRYSEENTGSQTMELIKKETIKTLVNPGFESQQLLFSENSTSERVTITRVRLEVGAKNRRHHHDTSEQIWVALSGRGELLLADSRTLPFEVGDVVRFADGDVHGLQNTSEEVFEYLSVTAPPINFRYAYQEEK